MFSPAPNPQGLMLFVEWSVLPPSTQRAVIDALSNADRSSADPSEPSGETESYPLNLPQARQLHEGIDEKTAEFLRQLVKRFDAKIFDDETCWMDFGDAWKIVGVNDKNEFAKGVLSGLHRRLRSINGDKAKLVLAYDKGGSDENGSYYIDNLLAVHALREVFKIK